MGAGVLPTGLGVLRRRPLTPIFLGVWALIAHASTVAGELCLDEVSAAVP